MRDHRRTNRRHRHAMLRHSLRLLLSERVAYLRCVTNLADHRNCLRWDFSLQRHPDLWAQLKERAWRA